MKVLYLCPTKERKQKANEVYHLDIGVKINNLPPSNIVIMDIHEFENLDQDKYSDFIFLEKELPSVLYFITLCHSRGYFFSDSSRIPERDERFNNCFTVKGY